MIYVYFCECGFEKEDWHSIIDEPEILCDKCGAIMKHKITGGVATHFKGFGWSTNGGDSTQGHHKPIHQIEMAVPVAAGGSNIVTNEAKKAADNVKVVKGI